MLADSYCSAERYRDSPAELLEPGARDLLIWSVLGDSSVDAFGLQEVESGLAETLLTSLGDTWSISYCPKGRGRVDGCLTGVRRDWLVIEEQQLYFHDSVAGGVGSGHVAQITHMKRRGQQMVVANTHLRWGNGSAGVGQTGQRQAAELAEVLVDQYGDLAVCVMGDINDRQGGPVRGVLEEAGFVEVQGASATAVVDGSPTSLDVIALINGVDLSSERMGLPLGSIPDLQWPSDHLMVGAWISLD